jgi:hypothetical protein
VDSLVKADEVVDGGQFVLGFEGLKHGHHLWVLLLQRLGLL